MTACQYERIWARLQEFAEGKPIGIALQGIDAVTKHGIFVCDETLIERNSDNEHGGICTTD